MYYQSLILTFVLRILVYRILKQVLISYRKFINNLISEV